MNREMIEQHIEGLCKRESRLVQEADLKPLLEELSYNYQVYCIVIPVCGGNYLVKNMFEMLDRYREISKEIGEEVDNYESDLHI
jgi:hypothetical protein